MERTDFFVDELAILWNDLTILWNDLTIDWNDLTWNDLTINDVIQLLEMASHKEKKNLAKEN